MTGLSCLPYGEERQRECGVFIRPNLQALLLVSPPKKGLTEPPEGAIIVAKMYPAGPRVRLLS